MTLLRCMPLARDLPLAIRCATFMQDSRKNAVWFIDATVNRRTATGEKAGLKLDPMEEWKNLETCAFP